MCEKSKSYPKFHVGDAVLQRVETDDGPRVRQGKCVGLFQSAEDPDKFSYTVRWANGVVEPLSEDAVYGDPVMERFTNRINGHIDELRSLFPVGVSDNTRLGPIFEEFEKTKSGMELWLEEYRQLCWLADLRNEILGL